MNEMNKLVNYEDLKGKTFKIHLRNAKEKFHVTETGGLMKIFSTGFGVDILMRLDFFKAFALKVMELDLQPDKTYLVTVDWEGEGMQRRYDVHIDDENGNENE